MPKQFFWEIPPQIYAPYHVLLTRDDGRKRSNVSGLGERHGRADNFVEAPSIKQVKFLHYSNITGSVLSADTRYRQGLSNAVKNNTNWFRDATPKRVKCSLRIYWREEE